MEPDPMDKVIDDLKKCGENLPKSMLRLIRRLVNEGVLTSYLTVVEGPNTRPQAAILATRESAIHYMLLLAEKIIPNEAAMHLLELVLRSEVSTHDCSKCDHRDGCPIFTSLVEPDEIN